MATFQMNPKAICADMAFHHPHDMQALYRMHNEKRIPTGPHTPWPNRAEMGVRLFKKFLLALVTQITPSGKTPLELAMGRGPRDPKYCRFFGTSKKKFSRSL